MKDSTKYANRLNKFLTQVRKEVGQIDEAEPLDYTVELILACLSSSTTESKAHTALEKIQQAFVDYNELRVARPDEIAELLGKTYPQAKDVAKQITDILQSLFDRIDALTLTHLDEMGKREAKAYLDELTGMTPYVSARMMIRCVKGHAFPVHEPMLEVLRKEEIVDAEEDLLAVQNFMERQIAASNVHEIYPMMRYYVDHYTQLKKSSGASKSAKKTTKKTASKVKKTTKKKTKKTTKKKTAKKS